MKPLNMFPMLVVPVLLMCSTAIGQLTTVDLNSGETPTTLVNALVGGGVTVSNVTYAGASIAAGTFSGGKGIIGFESGIILSSGNIGSVPGPNTSDSTTTANGTDGDSDLQSLIPGFTTFDAAVLEFDFECQGIDVISFQYVFTSEEYNEFVNSPFNNVFGFFVNGVNVALLPDGVTPVSINNVNGGNPIGVDASNSVFYINNDCSDSPCSINTEMDGLTVVLIAQANINPGVNHIKLAISDAGDSILDSNVFIKGASFICGVQEEPQPLVCAANGPYSAECQGTTTTLALDGSGSFDPGGDPLSFSWTTDCPAGTFDDASSSTPNLTVHSLAPCPLVCEATLQINTGAGGGAGGGACAPPTDWATGDVFVGVASGSYQVYDNAGTFKESISDGLGGFTTGCAFNANLSKLYTTNFSSTKVPVYDDCHPHAIVQTVDTNVKSPAGHTESIVFAENGDFYVGHPDGNDDIHRYDSAGAWQQSYDVAIDGRGSDWMDLAADQTTMFYTSEGGRIMRYDVGSDVQLADFANIGGVSYALRLLPPGDGSGGLLVANTGSVKRLDGSGTVAQTYDAPGEDCWFALNLDPNGTSFWSGDFCTANFYRFNIATGAVEVGPINTGTGSSTLFGVCLKGEPTAAVEVVSCTATVTIDDTTPPGITCPADISTSGGFGGTVVTFESSAVDACDSNPSVTSAPPSGSFFVTGVTSVTATAVDACTNESTCGFDVRVSCFGVNEAEISTDDDEEDTGVELEGSFVPAVPFDLSVDDVIFTIADGQEHAAVFTIPAGSFQAEDDHGEDKFEFKGVIGGMEIEAEFEDCEFEFEVEGAMNIAQLVGTTMTVSLHVGPNVGHDTFVMEDKHNHLDFEREPEVECCPECEGIAFMQVTSDQGVLTFEPEPGHDKLPPNTVVDDGVNGAATVHTSCSQPIDVGDVFGPNDAYTISELVKIFEEEDDR